MDGFDWGQIDDLLFLFGFDCMCEEDDEDTTDED